MKTRQTRLDRIRVKNFKAIRDSGSVKLTQLTVLIGNNGSGKSSLVEALQTVHAMVAGDVDRAPQLWRGIEHIRNKARTPRFRQQPSGELRSNIPLEFQLTGRDKGNPFSANSTINERGGANEVFFEKEFVKIGAIRHSRREGAFETNAELTKQRSVPILSPSHSLLEIELDDYIRRWQFLLLAPQVMGQPRPQTRSHREIQLESDGSNLAEYLLDIRSLDPSAFQGIIETLQFVLPYSADVQPTITSELERAVYLQMAEANFKVPGWLLSTGTLRILALLGCLRHPNPPPLLVVEEIENGLDPRTIHLVVEEIRAALEVGRTQLIVTTHSPFLLDLCDLSQIVVVERHNGQPRFFRPNEAELAEWSESFSPGRLYTMGRLTQGKP